jgi:hypothetical protein
MSLASHSAPGSNAGFSFQFERALFWLAKSSAGSVVGIETDDDVAIRDADTTQILEQDKHSIRPNSQPFGERSKDLWNTLATWIEAIDSNEVVVGKALFLMVTNKVLEECLAKQIGRAKTEQEIDASIEALKRAGESPPTGIKDLVKRVLRPTSSPNLRRLIERTRLFDGAEETPGENLRSKTIGHLQLPASVVGQADSILNELLGWMHKIALECWQKGQPAWIHRDNFVNQLHAILSQRKRRISRERAAHLLPVGDDRIGKERGSVFVQQLHLITEDGSIVDNAIREFIRCNIEKSRLSAEGNVTDDDWLAFESTLYERWTKIRARISRTQEDNSEEDVGFSVFTDTTESHREKLAGCETDQVYLTSGTYHRMAEEVKVGWHPRFEQLLQDQKKP